MAASGDRATPAAVIEPGWYTHYGIDFTMGPPVRDPVGVGVGVDVDVDVGWEHGVSQPLLDGPSPDCPEVTFHRTG